jgi:glyoxylase-like metal-dependent hydrolase (beta-lactamase superfamily II)
VKNGFYRFKLGDLACACLSDGSWNYPLQDLFANVTEAQMREALDQHDPLRDYLTTPYTYLYVNSGEHRVLVDMGAGDLFAPKAGKLLDSMKAAGIDPAQIDTVVITHAHPDHIGGTLDEEGQPIYANASYYISKEEWAFWFSEDSLVQAFERHVHIARRNLEPLRERVHLVEGEAEIVPGICAIPAPGHTPGHMVVSVSSRGEHLLYIGDTVVHPIHLEHPGWTLIYDILPEEAASSKQRIFDRAAAEQALVVGQHFAPFPSLGTVIKLGTTWQWRPAGRAMRGWRGRRRGCGFLRLAGRAGPGPPSGPLCQSPR